MRDTVPQKGRWRRFREAMKREFLRDPDVILFERDLRGVALSDGGHPGRI